MIIHCEKKSPKTTVMSFYECILSSLTFHGLTTTTFPYLTFGGSINDVPGTAFLVVCLKRRQIYPTWKGHAQVELFGTAKEVYTHMIYIYIYIYIYNIYIYIYIYIYTYIYII